MVGVEGDCQDRRSGRLQPQRIGVVRCDAKVLRGCGACEEQREQPRKDDEACRRLHESLLWHWMDLLSTTIEGKLVTNGSAGNRPPAGCLPNRQGTLGKYQ